MLKKVLFPTLFLIIAYFVLSNENAKIIIAGIAIFLVGMYFMEEGFALFSGGTLEKILQKFTNTLPKAITTGIIATSIVQSSSLTSVIIISFLSANLIGLTEAIGVVFGSNLGTTTTAWLVSYFGLKINISHYAMPMLIFGVSFRFSKSSRYQGFGNILLGLGFIFLGIAYMKEGFETLKSTIDLASYSMSGYSGVLLYIFIGSVATVVIQSSSATMAIIITALASGQIIYVNALALAIGANVGTTVTAMLGALSSNENGKRLAIAHLIFNIATALMAFAFITQLADFVDILAGFFGIKADNFVIKLAIFHTIFNILGIVLVVPFISIMVIYLKKLFIPKVKSRAKPKYLNNEVIKVPQTAILSLRKETINLYDKSIKTISHGMNLHTEELFSKENLDDIIKNSNHKIDTNIDKIYKENLKILYSQIIHFASIAQQNMSKEQNHTVGTLKSASKKIIKAVKDIKELQKNINYFSKSKNQYIKSQYNKIREEIAKTIGEVDYLRQHHLDDIDRISRIQALKQQIKSLDFIKNNKIDELIRNNKIDATMATSLINDASFGFYICKKLIDIAMILWVEDEILIQLGEEENED